MEDVRRAPDIDISMTFEASMTFEGMDMLLEAMIHQRALCCASRYAYAYECF
jgi:hypothetical protein